MGVVRVAIVKVRDINPEMWNDNCYTKMTEKWSCTCFSWQYQETENEVIFFFLKNESGFETSRMKIIQICISMYYNVYDIFYPKSK